MSTTSTPRGATPATVGGALWALVPVAFGLVDIESLQRGTVSFIAVAAVFWICGVLSLALLLVGAAGLRSRLGSGTGRLGAAGVVVSMGGLGAMLLGNGTEVATITFVGKESDLGHAFFLIGFLLVIAGSMLLGIALFRRRPERLARRAGLLMALALPVGVGLMVLGSVLFPGTDVGFWAGITVPTGLAWLLLDRSMTGPEAPTLATSAAVR